MQALWQCLDFRISHSEPTFANVKGHLDAGKWVRFLYPGNGRLLNWWTAESGVFGGNEKGSVEADFGSGRHVKFS